MRKILFVAILMCSIKGHFQTLIANPQNNGIEGGELQLKRSSSQYNDWNIDNYAGNLRFYHSGIEYFKMLPDGKITHLLTNRLEARSSSSLKTILNMNDQSAISFIPNNPNSWFHISHGLMNDLHFSHGGTVGAVKIMTIKNTGNVGIGTVNPQAKLQVQDGNILVGRSDQGGGEIYFGNPNHGIKREGNEISLFTAGGNESGISFAQKTWTGSAYNGWNVHMKITNTGNVGIGTTNPDAKLAVKGKIHAEEVKIDLNIPAPDYVFDNTYPLKSIEDVEQFIKENSHLPEIPSAKEFEEKGLLLAEMNMNLLKKIEELTLYTIQQQKEIKQLKKDNETLKSLASRLLVVEKKLKQ